MSGNSLKGYNNIRLTLLGPGGPGGVLQGGPLRRGFRPRGDGLDGPRLFGRQSLQTDVPLLKHLLDVLQALQCLQDVGLQEHSSPSTLPPSSLLQTARVCVSPYLNVLGQNHLVLVVEVLQFRQLVLLCRLQEALDVGQSRLCPVLRLTLIHRLRGQQVDARLTPLVHLDTTKQFKQVKVGSVWDLKGQTIDCSSCILALSESYLENVPNRGGENTVFTTISSTRKLRRSVFRRYFLDN